MDTSASKPKNPMRKTLTECFEEACSRFRSTVEPSLGKDRQRLDALTTFLKGASTGLQQLEKTCQNLNDKAEEKANNAAKILTTLDQFKTLGDAFLQFAPESVSIVWCAISSLITIGGAKLQTLLLICGACNSVTTIVGDCIRWEVRMRTTDAADDAPTLDIWDTDIPDLVFNILEFLWSAQPHLDNSRLKQTGIKINQVCDDLKKCATIGTDIIEAVQRQVLLDELDRQTARLQPSASHRTHFSTLRDRLAYIIRQRNGQPVARWLFKENAYHDWKHGSTSMLYLKSPRGYGKSIAMMSVHEDLQTPHYNNNPNSDPLNGDITKDAAVRHEQKPLLCSFFFKRGEQDIQLARTAFEYILHQMLSSSALRKNASTLAEIVEVLNPAFFDPAAQKTGFMDTLTALCQAIRDVSIAIPNRVYLMVDALDECQDRREQNFSQLLADMVKPQPESNKACSLKIIFSARDSIDIISELGCDKDINSLVPTADQTERLSTNILRIIEITAFKNWSDLDIYLRHEVKVVLPRRIDQSEGEAFAKLLDSELSRIVEIIHQKAKGDFTLARMIIATSSSRRKKL
ncbi:hypothetical protein Dda_8174 [Drechslerella dactyloides]|uniref:Nephrocystin 3-like N-terminal domain-containing protein n=1 Tax=Drechslerella dactyloides TaxID=74499 RepID=A0AAD6IRK2_DREDA|nr:hypothetical protein Dda_8174 [Drechslerella dactyloides]